MNGSRSRWFSRALFMAVLAVFFLGASPSWAAGGAAADHATEAAAVGALPSVSHPDIRAPRGWETRFTKYFRIHSEPADRVSAELLVENIDGWMEEAAGRVGQPIQGSIDLMLAPSYEAFMAIQPGDAPSWAVGTAYSELGLITVRSPRAAPSQSDYSLRQTTVHEIAHICLGWAFGEAKIPRWLHEGLAKYVAGETTWETRAHLSRAVLTGNLIPLGDLASDFPRSTARATLAYAQSLEFLSYLIDEYGSSVVPALIQNLSEGRPIDASLTAVTGVSFSELEQDWHHHLTMNFAWLPALTTGGGLWIFASMLLLVGWWRKKRESRDRRVRWEIEEALIFGTNLNLAQTAPASGALGKDAWPRHLQLIEGGKSDADPAEEDEDGSDLDEAVEVPRLQGFMDYEDDDERPPPGGWLH